MKEQKEKEQQKSLVNERIRAPRVQLITEKGENLGVVSRHQALQLAQEAHLDLVMIAEMGKEGAPVVKIMDHGKSLYEKKKKLAEAKKHQKVIQVKEVKISPKIAANDYNTKMKQVMQFLREGKRVKITLIFRGRERSMRDERGQELFDKIDQTFVDHGFTDSLAQEKDAKMGSLWSRVYYIK